jgi:hypothetical protein
MDSFDGLFLEEVPRVDDMNLDEAHSESRTGSDVSAVSTSTFQLSDELVNGQDEIEAIFGPSIPYNLEPWQIFIDDKQIFDRHDKYKKKKEIEKPGEYIEMDMLIRSRSQDDKN